MCSKDGTDIFVGRTTTMRYLLMYLCVLSVFIVKAQETPKPDLAFADSARRAIPMFTSQAGAFFGNRSLKVYPNNDILVVSTTLRDVPNNDRDLFTARLTPNGNLDATYGDTGTVRIDCGARIEYCNAVEIAPDGKAVLVGVQRDLFSSIDKILLVRINADGSLDNTFGGTGMVISDVSPVASISEGRYVKVLNNGKILVAARIRMVSGNPGFEQAIIRYNQNGSIDSTFGDNGIRYFIDAATADIAERLLLQSDNKILLQGTTTQSGIVKITLACTDENGTPDTTFGTGGTLTVTLSPSASFSPSDFILQQDGKFIVAGGVSNQLNLIRFNSNGSIDSTFGTNGRAITSAIRIGYKILSAPNGKLYAIGADFNEAKIVRYTANGQLDNTFGTNGVAVVSTANPSSSDLTGEILQDGSILVCGKWTLNDIDHISVLKVNIVSSPTGHDDIMVIPKMVYPNPANSFIQVQTTHQVSNLELLDIQGKIIKQQPHTNTIDVSEVLQGMYVLRCTDTNGLVSTSKVQVLHE